VKRDLLKTASFAALHFGVAFTVTYALTGSARNNAPAMCCGVLKAG